MKKNIAYIISFVSKSIAFEWIAEGIDTSKYNLYFILLNTNDTTLEKFLVSKGLKVYRVNYSGKKDLLSAFFKIRSILKQEKTNIVHTHLFDASFVGLAAASFSGIKKRIHTRHNSTIHHDYHPQAVKYDRIINKLSTHIVAVSEVVKKVLVEMENADPKKIMVINHGFSLTELDSISPERKNTILKKYKIDPSKKNIGVISRYIHWKGIQYLIPAFEKLLHKFPNAHLILANANGPYKKEVQQLLKKLPADSYTEIEFEEDGFALYGIFDVFVHTPIDEKSEAFGQVYVEAMAAGVASVITLSGIATEFVKDRKNALVVPFKNSEEIYKSVAELLENDNLRNEIIVNGKQSVKNLFTIEKMITELENLYG